MKIITQINFMNIYLHKKIRADQTTFMGVTQELLWKIVKTEAATACVKNFYLEPIDEEMPTFIAGQYLTVKLPYQGPAEGKAYSISSAPYEPLVRLSVKQIGSFSEGILSHEIGDTLLTTKPYGFFYPEPTDTNPLIFVVGGIGITPCLSIIKDLVHNHDGREIHLHYSNQTEQDITFSDELSKLETQHEPLTVYHYVTRKMPQNNLAKFGRMQAKTIIEKINFNQEPEFFICGAMDFTKSLWKEIHQAGVPQHQLYTEGFF